jgi:hypothetical protein
MRSCGGARAVLLSAAALSFMTIPNAMASPWPREKGRLFLSTRGAYFSADGDSSLAGALDRPRFERVDSEVYAEYGLTRKATLAAKVVYSDATYFDGFDARGASGFSEIEVGAQHGILRRTGQSLAVKISASTFPAGLEDGSRPGDFGEDIDAELRVLYGRDLALKPFKIYATAETAYRRRFGDGADQGRADLLLGLEPFKRTLILLEAQSRWSLGNEEPGGADYDVVALQPSFVWRQTKRWAVQIGLTHEAAARNLDRGTGYFLALWSEF